MRSLQITRAKPNPRGKDRTRAGTTVAQLAAEWIDIKNTSHTGVLLTGVDLYHKAYSPDGSSQWEKVVSLSGVLPGGNTLRVHAGQVRPISVISNEDILGAEYHNFTGRDEYVWNNREGDHPGLWIPATKEWVDLTSYDPNPPEGAVLVRSGAKLVPASVAAYSRM
jgi:hypothetical protein